MTHAPSRVPRICLGCGRLFLAQPRWVRIGRCRYCSRRCASRAGTSALRAKRPQGQRGALNPHWKGGVSRDKGRYKRRFRQRYPLAAAAHDAVRSALRSGDLIKLPCHDCGSIDDVHAHHDDYRRPLDVIWQCRRCHRAAHWARRLAGLPPLVMVASGILPDVPTCRAGIRAARPQLEGGG